jgi:hypothetical protein
MHSATLSVSPRSPLCGETVQPVPWWAWPLLVAVCALCVVGTAALLAWLYVREAIWGKR